MMVEVISAPTERTARKVHFCDNCGGVIYPKEKYLISTFKYDDFFTWKDHIRCASLVAKCGDVFDNEFGEGIDPIFSWEDGYLSEPDEKERIAIVELAQKTRKAPYGEPPNLELIKSDASSQPPCIEKGMEDEGENT